MKKLIISLLTSYLLVPVFGQFQHSYGTIKSEYGNSISTTHFDGGNVIGGYSNYGFLSNGDATLIKTNLLGDIEWARLYGGSTYDLFNSIKPISTEEDRGYVCLGTTDSYGMGRHDFFFVRTDKEGNPLIFRTYGSEREDFGNYIQVIDDVETRKKGLIMIGYSNGLYGESNSYKIFVVKTDLDGNIIRSAIVGNIANHLGKWIEQTEDGGFILVGMSSFTCGNNGSTPYYDMFVAKLKPDLELEWARIIGGGADLPYTDYATSVKETKDGYILSGSTKSFGKNNSNDAFLLKLSKKGVFKWLKTYGNAYRDSGAEVLNEESAELEHQYLLAGQITVGRSQYVHLIASDIDGNLIWNRAYGKVGIQSGHKIDRGAREGYSFVGTEGTFGVGENNIYHVATDNYGNSYCPACEIFPKIEVAKHEPCIREGGYSIKAGMTRRYDPRSVEGFFETVHCEVNTKSTENELSNTDVLPDIISGIQASPNPANQYIEIIYAEKYIHGSIQIFNSSGQLLINTILPNQNKTSLLLDRLENGIYMLSISNNKGDCESLKFVVSK